MTTNSIINETYMMLNCPTTELYEKYYCNQKKEITKKDGRIYIIYLNFCKNDCIKNAAAEIALIYSYVKDYHGTTPTVATTSRWFSKKKAQKLKLKFYPAIIFIEMSVKDTNNEVCYITTIFVNIDDIANDDNNTELYSERIKFIAEEFSEEAHKERESKLLETIG